jgi:hypothetical protein
LANLTPDDLRPFTKKGSFLWRDGFLARFALVTPQEGRSRRDRFPSGKRIIPGSLLTPLVEWNKRLGYPSVGVKDVLNDKGDVTGKKVLEIHGEKVTTLDYSPDVYNAFYTYHDAMLDIVENSENHDLDGNYARFAEKCLRLALLFASVSGSQQIELKHWARAQTITERWRSGLHELYKQVNMHDISQQRLKEDQVMRILQKLGKATAAKLAQYIRNMSTAEISKILDSLVSVGSLTFELTLKKTRRYIHPSGP